MESFSPYPDGRYPTRGGGDYRGGSGYSREGDRRRSSDRDRGGSGEGDRGRERSPERDRSGTREGDREWYTDRDRGGYGDRYGDGSRSRSRRRDGYPEYHEEHGGQEAWRSDKRSPGARDGSRGRDSGRNYRYLFDKRGRYKDNWERYGDNDRGREGDYRGAGRAHDGRDMNGYHSDQGDAGGSRRSHGYSDLDSGFHGNGGRKYRGYYGNSPAGVGQRKDSYASSIQCYKGGREEYNNRAYTPSQKHSAADDKNSVIPALKSDPEPDYEYPSFQSKQTDHPRPRTTGSNRSGLGNTAQKTATSGSVHDLDQIEVTPQSAPKKSDPPPLPVPVPVDRQEKEEYEDDDENEECCGSRRNRIIAVLILLLILLILALSIALPLVLISQEVGLIYFGSLRFYEVRIENMSTMSINSVQNEPNDTRSATEFCEQINNTMSSDEDLRDIYRGCHVNVPGTVVDYQVIFEGLDLDSNRIGTEANAAINNSVTSGYLNDAFGPISVMVPLSLYPVPTPPPTTQEPGPCYSHPCEIWEMCIENLETGNYSCLCINCKCPNGNWSAPLDDCPPTNMTGFNCQGYDGWNFPEPSDCSQFYACPEGQPMKNMTCADGGGENLIFDPVTENCQNISPDTICYPDT